MKRQYWTLKFVVHILREGRYLTGEILTPLPGARLYTEAEGQAMEAVVEFGDLAKEKNIDKFRDFCPTIREGDKLVFTSFRLIGLGWGEVFKGKLDCHVPSIIT
jgi:hypothetical protein